VKKVQNVNELRGRIVTVAECVTNEMLAITWRETKCRVDMCRATNGAHTESYWAHTEHCEVPYLKMYSFFQYALW
jgi:hypothetical protein